MKSFILFISITFFGLIISCNEVDSQSKTSSISAIEFSNSINKNKTAQLIDVRTEGEFTKGHIKNAKNVDFNNSDFQTQISKLDKNKPVYIYCLSGGRSSAAIRNMSKLGFKEIYELNGGMMKWRASNMPETTDSGVKSAELNKNDYAKMLKTDKLVLVDFYADWCAPCKKMKPYLEEIANEMKEKINIERINADDSKLLAQELNISALPTLILYKNGTEVWKNTGYLSKDEIVKNINNIK